MKRSNIALSALLIMILLCLVWVNTTLKAMYYDIDLTDTMRNYQTVVTDQYSILKIRGSNGYPIEIKQAEQADIKVLRSRMSQFAHRVDHDTLIIDFSGARVSAEYLLNSTTATAIIIQVPEVSEIILQDTHNRISGMIQPELSLRLEGSSYTELSDNHFGTFSLIAQDASRFEFKSKSAADTAHFELVHGSVGFLDGLSYHVFNPVLQDSALLVLSQSALGTLMHRK